MNPPILGLHHVTATVDEAQADLDCYVGALGLRLVKKTVNFDNPSVYHFYYGDEVGTPGTLMTTFPYGGWGVPVGRHGAGQIVATAFSVPAASVAWWRDRLAEAGSAPEPPGERFGDEVVAFTDPSGLRIELVGTDADPRAPWLAEGFGADRAVRGVASATLCVSDRAGSVRFLTDVLGWDVVGEAGDRTRLAAGEDRPGHHLEIVDGAQAPPASNGLGTVHHVAMAVQDEEAQARVREHLVRSGVSVTPVRDRQYFKSIYFREPGGVLYEVATLPPGFAIDEDPRDLGRGLKLPPWEEQHRASIESALPPVRY